MKPLKIICMVLCFWLLFHCAHAGVEPPSDLATAIKMLFDFPSKIENLDDLFDLFSEISKDQLLSGAPVNSVTAAGNPLPNPNPIVSEKVPKGADEAIHDFRRTIARDFIKYAGSPDGTMSRNQFQTLVSDGCLPVKEDPDEYFQDHDKDGNGKLSIGEFVPNAFEVAKKRDLDVITQAYKNGSPYPTGNYPVSRPLEAPPGPPPGSGTGPLPPQGPVFISKADIEQRITDFANQNGFTTVRRPDGKLGVVDQNGQPVPIPPKVLPAPLPLAVQKLTEFSKTFGGSVEKGPEGMPLVKDKNGKGVPVDKWPPDFRPPYLPPPQGPPPPPAPPPP